MLWRVVPGEPPKPAPNSWPCLLGRSKTNRLMVGMMEAFRGREICGLLPALADAAREG